MKPNPHLASDSPQYELFSVEPGDPNVEWLVDYLSGMDWVTAQQILEQCSKLGRLENNKRWLRALAAASKGRVAGGQRGYKLVEEMTVEEYNHWRNWMKRQADFMTARILEADKVFYRRKKVRTGNGILTPEESKK
jgi:hypothetical protein